MEYDCIVVGARCAGAPLARFAARVGKRVLVIDAAELPRDQPLSTHFIHPYGMRVLDELDLGKRVRELAPPVGVFINGLDDHIARIRWPAGEGGCCLRRTDLDALLLDGAREAGAEVRLGCKAVDVVRDGDRVVGVVVEKAGVRSEIRAGVVVGGDGRNSTIARLVGAEEYNGYDSARSFYWAYWQRPAWYDTDPRYEGGAVIVHRGDDFLLIFPVNRDQLLVGAAFPTAHPDSAAWRAEPLATLERRLRADPITAPAIEGSPISKVIGLRKIRYFFRRAAGKGWALVGDAGLCKDPTPGLGISDALRDARALGNAIVTGGDAALERYWRQRDVESTELFYFARDVGEPGYNNALNRLVFAKMAASAEVAGRIRDVVDRSVSPFDAFPTGEIMRWTLGALIRGNFRVLRPFFAAGMRIGRVKRELKLRQQLAQPALPPG